MENGKEFIDYYSLLQVHPKCGAAILKKAYRQLAQIYHPDHPDTFDLTKFQQVIEAYSVLKDPEERAKYDQIYRFKTEKAGPESTQYEDFESDETSALDDAEVHKKILLYLYKRRREYADEPGVLAFYVQQMLNCSYENFEFHSWYLKSKGFLITDEQGMLEVARFV